MDKTKLNMKYSPYPTLITAFIMLLLSFIDTGESLKDIIIGSAIVILASICITVATAKEIKHE